MAICVEEIASFWKSASKFGCWIVLLENFLLAADVLVENDFIGLILEKIPTESDNLVVIYLSTLKYLMYEQGKEIALNCGAFHVFVGKKFWI